MTNVIISINVDQEIKEHIDNNTEIENLSHWFREKYRKEFLELETLTRQLSDLIKLEQKKKDEILRLKNSSKKLKDEIPELALKWLETEGKRRLKKYTTEGVYKYFVNKFNLHGKINRRKFNIIAEVPE